VIHIKMIVSVWGNPGIMNRYRAIHVECPVSTHYRATHVGCPQMIQHRVVRLDCPLTLKQVLLLIMLINLALIAYRMARLCHPLTR
jgi:hypothetical protein